jgi:hypothetical protein
MYTKNVPKCTSYRQVRHHRAIDGTACDRKTHEKWKTRLTRAQHRLETYVEVAHYHAIKTITRSDSGSSPRPRGTAR